ncbi:MAG: ABC transporter permease [Oscillospiraceae bacterium]|nr:ABC transporter permease [Oscillospiraceae bacterium]
MHMRMHDDGGGGGGGANGANGSSGANTANGSSTANGVGGNDINIGGANYSGANTVNTANGSNSTASSVNISGASYGNTNTANGNTNTSNGGAETSNNGDASGGFLLRVFGPRPINRSLFLTNLRRYWPGAALMMLVYLIYAITQFVELSGYFFQTMTWVPEPEYISDESSIVFGIFAFIAGLIAAMLCFHYLMNQRETIMSHSLPIKRESHLLSAALSGLTLLGAPIIAGGGLFFVVFALRGLFYPIAAIHWIIANLSIAFFGFCIAAFFAMLTGNSIAHGILTLIFINLPIMVEMVFINYCERFLFGFIIWVPLTRYINPFYHIAIYFSNGADRYYANILPDFLPPLLFVLVGLVFLALAVLLYRRRNLETAGDIISLRQVRPFLRYGVALGVSFIFSLIYNGATYINNYSPIWEIIFSIVGGAIGFFIAEMFIRRTIHVFRLHYMGAIGFAIVFIAVFFTIYNDLPGYGRMKLDAGAIDYIVIQDIKPRVRQAIEGEPLSFFGTIEDLDIDDPGGYLDGRINGKQYRPNGPVPQYIARQIIERDHSVLRGEDAQTAVSFQHFLADNSLRFGSGRATPSMYRGNTAYNTRNVRFIARYKNGRIIERNYSVRLYTAIEASQPETLESMYYSHLSNVQYLNMLAERKYLIDCAARANYVQFDFPMHIVENYMASRQDADLYPISGGSERAILGWGQYNGLFEAYQLDGIQQGDEGEIKTQDDYPSRWVYDQLLVNVEIMMPDEYKTSLRIGVDDINSVRWFVQKGFIRGDILEKLGDYLEQ